MKNTLIFSMLAVGLTLTGCNKSTRTDTATTATTPADTTATASTTVPATGDTVGAKIDRAGERVADASRNAADNVRDASRRAGDEIRETSREAGAAMRNAGHNLNARFTEWRLNNADIEADVRADREIVRTNSTAGAPTGKIDKGTIEKAIKGRLNSDPMFNGQKFDANANAKGEVTLEGAARTIEQISHAIAVALDTEGVTKVTSKIDLDKDAGSDRR